MQACPVALSISIFRHKRRTRTHREITVEYNRWKSLAVVAAIAWLAGPLHALAGISHDGDPHYTEAGFFDIHVCHWPDQPLFYMALFSTARFDEVDEIEIADPDGHAIGQLDLTKYRAVLIKGKPEKHVFISHLEIPQARKNGWYQARIKLKDGTTSLARDYVVVGSIPLPGGVQPADQAELPDVPTELRWEPVPGAKFYQVFIKDVWGDGQIILTSKLLDRPRLTLPPGLLQRGGVYSWRVHARDIDEGPTQGDFNQGTLSREVGFSVAAAPR